MPLSDFYRGTNKNFTVLVKQDGVPIDISSDSVRLVLKAKKSDADASAAIDVTADVATDGANGNAQFALSDTDTDIATKKYFYEILYNPNGGGEYVVDGGIVRCLEKVAD